MLKFTVDDNKGSYISAPFGKTKGQFIDLMDTMEAEFEKYREAHKDDEKGSTFSMFINEFINSQALKDLGWNMSNANEFFLIGFAMSELMDRIKANCCKKGLGGLLEHLMEKVEIEVREEKDEADDNKQDAEAQPEAEKEE